MEDDKDYFYKRAENELEMAQKTENAAAVKAHYTLASYYLDKVYSDGGPQAANDDPTAPGSVAG